MRQEIRNYLAADAELAAILTGGIYATIEVSRQDTPDAFDEYEELLPAALVKLETTTSAQRRISAEQTFLVLYFYANTYEAIEAAAARSFGLLNEQRVSVAGRKIWTIEHVEDRAGLTDPVMNCPMVYSRYRIVSQRA